MVSVGSLNDMANTFKNGYTVVIIINRKKKTKIKSNAVTPFFLCLTELLM